MIVLSRAARRRRLLRRQLRAAGVSRLDARILARLGPVEQVWCPDCEAVTPVGVPHVGHDRQRRGVA